MTTLPILYSFRRCPYAMRARMALTIAEQSYEHREVVLRDKPGALLEVSPKGTVPVLVLHDKVIDESEDIMLWALAQKDPQGWLGSQGELGDMRELVRRTEDELKVHLDRYKYADRYPGVDANKERHLGSKFLWELDQQLAKTRYLFGERFMFADAAIAPFVRQFANTDRAWFDEQSWESLRRWIEEFLESRSFVSIMNKHPQWVPIGEVADY